MKTKVYLRLDDQDRHGTGCSCGKCNSNGKSYGAGVFKAGEDDAIFVEYGASEESAMLNAKIEAEARNFEVVPEPDEEMIDRHDLASLEAQYKELYLAQLTDDVDCSPSTWQHRESCLKAIEEKVGKFVAASWSRETEAKAKEVGMASGAPYEE